MRRRVVRDHNGEAVTAEDVLEPDVVAEYRRLHPRERVHQMHFYPDYAAEEYERFQREKDSE